MKLTVICGETRQFLLPSLRILFDNLFIETRAWRPQENGEAALSHLEDCLAYSSHALCILTAEDCRTCWFHYVLGHQRGRRDRMAVWMDPDQEIPDWISPYKVMLGNDEEILAYYSSAGSLWNKEMGRKQACKAIVDNGLEISDRSFIDAVLSGERFLTGLFLDAGFSPSLQDSTGVPVLSHAIRGGHSGLVSVLLNAGADANRIAEDRGATPLMDAAALGHQESVRWLLDLEADVEHVGHAGQSAVVLAVGNGWTDTALLLIEAGADVDREDALGMSARKYAALYRQEAILDAI